MESLETIEEKSYQIKLPTFEGPLDLLLHLIRDQEIDIYDIPISQITEQYIAYIELMRDLNLDVAGEFLVMAATLTHIKSRLLLPKPDPVNPDEEEGDDPRNELVRKLLEYKIYKETTSFLRDREEFRGNIYVREPAKESAAEGENMLNETTLFDLLSAFNKLLNSIGGTSSKEINLDEISVTEKINYIMDALSRHVQMRFEDLFPASVTYMEIVATFMALLELIRIKLVKIKQAQLFGSIIIYRNENKNGTDNN